MQRVAWLCTGYFLSYVVFLVVVKYYINVQGMPGMNFLFYSTLGSATFLCTIVIGRWWPGRLQSTAPRIWGWLPRECAWLIPSGIATGFVIPTTTLLYTFIPTVMVAMIVMRGSLIVISRIVDEILIRQGHSDKEVLWQENMAVAIAMAAVVLVIVWAPHVKEDAFDFLRSIPVLVTMAVYIFFYGIRIYILSRFKTKIDSRALFGIEQLGASGTIIVFTVLAVVLFRLGWQPQQLIDFNYAVFHWNLPVILLSIPFGLAAFASVFLFIHKQGSATFNVTVNRLTSLMAGTAATLVCCYGLGLRAVRPHEWVALGIILVAIGFLGWAARIREKQEATT